MNLPPVPDYLDPNDRIPRSWPNEQKLAYAESRVKKLLDRYPHLVDSWIKEMERLEKLINAN